MNTKLQTACHLQIHNLHRLGNGATSHSTVTTNNWQQTHLCKTASLDCIIVFIPAAATAALKPCHCSRSIMSYTQEQMDEVWAWIHDEQRCVTTQTVSLAMGIPRSVASSLLSDLSRKAGDHSYECTKCNISQQNGTIGESCHTQHTHTQHTMRRDCHSHLALFLMIYMHLFALSSSDSTAQEHNLTQRHGCGR